MSKISELTDGGSLLPTDFLIAVRSGGNVKVQADDITVDQIRLGDNEKIELGNSQDLQIYHDGYHSIIEESGAGSLLIRGDHTYFTNSAGTEGYADFIADGAVILRHNNLQRLSTSATGINVTGAGTFSGAVTVAGNLINFNTGSGNAPYIQHTGNQLDIRGGTGSTRILNNAGSQSTVTIRDTGNVIGSGLDVTGSVTTTGNVGIGCTPVMPLDVMANSGANALSLRTRVGDDYSFFTFRSNDGTEDLGGLAINRTAASTSNLLFYTNNGGSAAERLRIDASGSVGIGTVPNSGGHNFWSNLSMGTKGSLISSRGAGGAYGMLVTDNLYIPQLTGSFAYRTTDEASYYKQDAGYHLWYNAPSGTAGAAATLTERMQLDVNGHLIIPAGVTLGTAVGVYAAANTLDDYEEGTWTPAPARLTGGSITTDGTITATGSYTKIGRQVTIVCNIAITGTITQGTSNTSITGIPFLPITSPRQHPSAIGAQSALTNNVNDASGINADYAYNALTTRDDNPWVAGSLHFTCTYFTAA